MTILSRYVDLHPTSRVLHGRAAGVFPDGVTHDIRAQLPFPLYATEAAGARKRDVDGNEYVDFVMGHGALLMGHSHPAIVEAVCAQATRGTHFGASHEAEIRWGELVQQLVPSAERVRFVSSGTEATMMAVRLARAKTGREKLLRLRQHFHGWNDSVTGQPKAEETVPAMPGLPRGTLESSIVIAQNDAAILERTLREDGGDIAAMIFEPTGPHFGRDQIDISYVKRARELTAEHGVLLIFDEVVTGFRIAAGGAQQVYDVRPDITTLAKVLAGGLPGGAVAGRADILDQISFAAHHGEERIEHPGTFNANPLSAAAGSTCLSLIADGTHQIRAAEMAALVARGMNGALREASIPGSVYGLASILHIALGMEEQPPDGYSWGFRSLPDPPPRTKHAVAQALRLALLNEGVDLMRSDLMIVTSAHTKEDAGDTVEGFRRALAAMKEEKLL